MSRQCIVLTLRHRDYGITVTGRFEVYTHPGYIKTILNRGRTHLRQKIGPVS